jgi:hypothetical protein
MKKFEMFEMFEMFELLPVPEPVEGKCLNCYRSLSLSKGNV